ncbi:MAG: glycosyltransferase family 9 protein, partial [Bacteroidetes bacterium]|nr:glycosyltransferase family 9 protein [Bacteroidota bacterium]
AFPSATLDVLTEPPGADIVRSHPAVSEALVYDRHAISSLGLIRMVRRRGYDVVFDLFGNPRTALVTRLSGAKVRIGYRFRWRTYAYTLIVEPRGGGVHNTQFNLDALEAAGVPVTDRAIRMYPSDDDRRMVSQFLQSAGLEGKPLVGINIGGGWYTKRWPLDRFAALADRISAELGWRIVLPWGPGQREEVEQLRHLMRTPAVLPPATSLLQLAALFERCRYVVSNDSGPMHIAAASGSRVLGIYGPTRPELQGPYEAGHATVRREGLECLGCNLTKCTIGNLCMTELSVDTVFEAFRRLMQTTPQTIAVG